MSGSIDRIFIYECIYMYKNILCFVQIKSSADYSIHLMIICIMIVSFSGLVYIIEQYSLRPSMLLAKVESILDESCVDLVGLEGLDDDLDGGRADLVADFLVEVLLDLAELADFRLTALAGLTGVLKSCSTAPTVKLNSLIGDTEDLLLAAFDFLVDCVLLVERFALLTDEDAVFFLIDVGVLAFDCFGLGVPLMGFEARLAGVAVCLAILFLVFLYIKLIKLVSQCLIYCSP